MFIAGFDLDSVKQARPQKGLTLSPRVCYSEKEGRVMTSCYFNRELKPGAKTELSKLSRERKGQMTRDIA